MDINTTSAASKKAGGFKNKKHNSKSAKVPQHPNPVNGRSDVSLVDEIDNIVTT